MESPFANFKTSADWCKHFKEMDIKYGTTKDSPLHHDNRCILMVKD